MTEPSSTYTVLKFSASEPQRDEEMGTKPKSWFDRDGDDWLFKEGRSNSGENWSEKAASELAALMGLRHATVELAVKKGETTVRGTASKSFLKPTQDLVHGNELLADDLDAYDKDRHYDQEEHRLDIILDALKSRVPSKEMKMFVGYLVFDGWIANNDRHHENWAIIRGEDGETLAPSYDHASSLGRLQSDKARLQILNEEQRKNTEKFLTNSKANGAIYTGDSEQVPPFSLLSELCNYGYDKSVRHWLSKIDQLLDNERPRDIFERFASDWMSEPAKRFAVKILRKTFHLMRDQLR